MTPHDLKTDPEPFRDLLHRVKTFELRENDRNYRVGDLLILREFAREPDGEARGYTGRAVIASVTHLIHGPAYGIPEGHTCMSIRLLARTIDGNSESFPLQWVTT